MVVTTRQEKRKRSENEIRVLGEGQQSSHLSLWKSRNERRYSVLTVRHSRHRGLYFLAEMSSTRLRGWFVESKNDEEGGRENERDRCGRTNPEFTNRGNVTACHGGGTERAFGATTGRCKTWRG